MSGDEAENVYPQSLNVQKPVDTPSTPFLVPSVPPAPYRQVHSSTSSALGLSGGLPWDNIVIGSTSEDISSDQKVSEDIWITCIALVWSREVAWLVGIIITPRPSHQNIKLFEI